MKKVLEFLGLCHNPNSVRGVEFNDRIAVVIDDTFYSYSLDSDKKEVASHVIALHVSQNSDCSENEVAKDVYGQLNLKLDLGQAPIETPLKAKKKASKKVSKKK